MRRPGCAIGDTSVGQTHRVVILGGGFGGLNAAQKLKRAPVEVTLIDRRNFHLFQPLLYQVATGSLSPGCVRIRFAHRSHGFAELLLRTRWLAPVGSQFKEC
jgi:glycine/D-amino acid oxidase-like deaminating enzyme